MERWLIPILFFIVFGFLFLYQSGKIIRNFIDQVVTNRGELVAAILYAGVSISGLLRYYYTKKWYVGIADEGVFIRKIGFIRWDEIESIKPTVPNLIGRFWVDPSRYRYWEPYPVIRINLKRPQQKSKRLLARFKRGWRRFLGLPHDGVLIFPVYIKGGMEKLLSVLKDYKNKADRS